ncbi:hypothetical protein DSO57_1018158 [Entomophthora muscae]|uniref:Uncharacterized protein n=1 Tax=Entomophthora muscae TaxID=34485 RepID=A0ACC2ST96_9FUNG|nr:hypothetical protein DSO57_1018158 [Entomophthora muscae]
MLWPRTWLASSTIFLFLWCPGLSVLLLTAGPNQCFSCFSSSWLCPAMSLALYFASASDVPAIFAQAGYFL